MDPSPSLARLAECTREWVLAHALGVRGAPKLLAFPLAHRYTPQSISFSALKGSDAAASALLRAPSSVLDVYLVLIKRQRREHDHEDDDEDKMEQLELVKWVAPDDTCLEAMRLSVDLNREVLQGSVSLWFKDPDSSDAIEITGNEGSTYDAIYYRALFVLWPRERTQQVLSKAVKGGFVSAVATAQQRVSGGWGGVLAALNSAAALMQVPSEAVTSRALVQACTLIEAAAEAASGRCDGATSEGSNAASVGDACATVATLFAALSSERFVRVATTDAAAAALARLPAAFAPCGAEAVERVSTALQGLLEAFASSSVPCAFALGQRVASPELRARLESAVVDSALFGGAWVRPHSGWGEGEFVLGGQALARLVFGGDASTAVPSTLTRAEAFAAAAVRQGGAALLQALAAEPAVLEAASRAADPHALAIVCARVVQLEEGGFGGPPPAHSWAMPLTPFSAHPFVRAFLLSQEQTQVLRIADFYVANDLKEKLLSSSVNPSLHSVTVEVTYSYESARRGVDLTMHKTSAHHDARVCLHRARAAELQGLRAVVAPTHSSRLCQCDLDAHAPPSLGD